MDAVSSHPNAPGSFRVGQSAVEMQQPATVVVRGKGLFQHAVVDVAIGAHCWRGGAVVIHPGVQAGLGIFESHAGQRREGCAVNGYEVSGLAVVHCDIKSTKIGLNAGAQF